MAIVRDISSLYVDFIAPLAELSRVRREIDAGDMQPVESSNAIELILDDGSTYEHPGRLLFSSAVVDETTGQVLLRAEFENPQGKLLPGTYVRVRVTEGVAHQAVLVPQRAVQWDTLGQASVMTVRDGKAAAQPILTSRSVGNRWLVTQGLKSGDQVIVDGSIVRCPVSPSRPLRQRRLQKRPPNAARHQTAVPQNRAISRARTGPSKCRSISSNGPFLPGSSHLPLPWQVRSQFRSCPSPNIRTWHQPRLR